MKVCANMGIDVIHRRRRNLLDFTDLVRQPCKSRGAFCTANMRADLFPHGKVSAVPSAQIGVISAPEAVSVDKNGIIHGRHLRV